MIFKTEYGKIEFRKPSEKEPLGYVYFFGEDYETTCTGQYDYRFKSSYGTCFRVLMPSYPYTGDVVLEVQRFVKIATTEIDT